MNPDLRSKLAVFDTLPFVVFLVGFMAIYLTGLVVAIHVTGETAYLIGFVVALIGSKLKGWAADWQQTRREVQTYNVEGQ